MKIMRKVKKIILNDKEYETGPYLKEIEVWPSTPELPFWEMELHYMVDTLPSEHEESMDELGWSYTIRLTLPRLKPEDS